MSVEEDASRQPERPQHIRKWIHRCGFPRFGRAVKYSGRAIIRLRGGALYVSCHEYGGQMTTVRASHSGPSAVDAFGER
jgi:hypothetical protein